jgi:hypothetical protein
MAVTCTVACTCGAGVIGRIDDRPATGGALTVWSLNPPPRWQDSAEQTIRCAKCRHPAQLSPASASAVTNALAPFLGRAPAVIKVDDERIVLQRITDPDGQDRLLVQITLKTLGALLSKVDRLRDGT